MTAQNIQFVASSLRRFVPFVFVAVVASALFGCQPKVTRLKIVDLADPSMPQDLYETFDDNAFRHDDHGNVTVTLRRVGPSRRDAREMIEQIVIVQSAFRPVPGRSPAEATMINATVHYIITAEGVTLRYRGAGFVTFTASRDGKRLVGKIESAELTPLNKSRSSQMAFGRSHITGSFIAMLDPREVGRIIRQCNVPDDG